MISPTKRAARAKSPPASAKALLRLAHERELEGDYAGAREACARACRAELDSMEARDRLRSFEEHLGLNDAARKSARAVYRLMRRGLRPDSAPELLRAAELAEEIGDLAACRAHLLAALTLDPGLRPALLKLGTLELWSGRPARASELARRALGLGGTDPALRTLAGAAAVARGKPREGLKLLNAVLRDDPLDTLARTWRGEALLRLGRPKAALPDLEDVVSRSDNPLGPNALLSLAALGAGRTPSVWALVCVARRLPVGLRYMIPAIRSGEPRRTAAALRAVLERLGGNRTGNCVWLAGPRGRRRLAFYLVSDAADALEELQKGLLRREPPGRVIGRLESCARAGADPAWAYAFLGETRMWLGDYAGAARDFKSALAIEPDMRWPHIGLGAAALLRGRPDEALGHLADAEAAGAPRRSWLAFRGEALRLLGRPTEAALDLEEALALLPRRLSAWFNLALARLEAGKTSEAAEIFDRLALCIPRFLARAAREARVSEERAFARPAPGTMRRVLSAGLALMRGNRSSWLYLHFGDGGRPRAIHASFPSAS